MRHSPLVVEEAGSKIRDRGPGFREEVPVGPVLHHLAFHLAGSGAERVSTDMRFAGPPGLAAGGNAGGRPAVSFPAPAPRLAVDRASAWANKDGSGESAPSRD